MYFWSWKRRSSPLRWRLLNTALDQERFRLPPLAAFWGMPGGEDVEEGTESLMAGRKVNNVDYINAYTIPNSRKAEKYFIVVCVDYLS